MTIDKTGKNDEEEKFIKICPKCYSEDTSPDFSNIGGIGYGALNSWRCMRCGYVADRSLFPEIPENEKPIPLDLSDVKRDYPIMDISVGKIFIKLGKIVGPLGLLMYLPMVIFSSFSAYLLFLPVFVYISLYSYSKKCRENKMFRNIGFFVFFYGIALMFFHPIF